MSGKKIDLKKCIFLFPVKTVCGNTDREEIKDILGEKNYTNYCAELGEYQGTFFEQDLEKYQNLNKRKNLTFKRNIYGLSFLINMRMREKLKTISGRICGQQN